VRQVGYLQELNQDARSTKHEILQDYYLCSMIKFVIVKAIKS